MPFIRLCDNYIDNPKFLAISEGSFCLWHEGMAYTRKHQTDGIIPFAALKTFRFHTKGREKQLSTPHVEGANPLWVLIPKTGYKVHDYLEWNPSREEENERRADSKERMRQFRERRSVQGTPIHPVVLQRHEQQTNHVRAQNVLDRSGTEERSLEKGSGEKPARVVTDEDLGDRARELLEHYPEWFRQERGGAKLRIIFNNLQFQDALSLCELWDDTRLEKLARVVLSTDDPFIAGTDRGWKIFVLKASWADDKLRQWEQANQVGV